MHDIACNQEKLYKALNGCSIRGQYGSTGFALASKLTKTDVTSQKTQFYLLYRDLRHATTINRSQMLHEHGV